MAVAGGVIAHTRRTSLRTVGSLALLVVVLLVAALWWSAGSAAGAEAADETSRAAVQGAPVGQLWPILWLAAGALVAALAWLAAARAGRREPTAAN